jgi:V/A-type H+-transporting ATPase subunit I
MIVPMKKITIIVQAKDADSSVLNLRALGVLHVEHVQSPMGKDISTLKEDITLITSGINILSEQEYLKLSAKEQIQPADWKFVTKHIIDLSKRLEQLEEYARTLQARISEWERWGDFDPQEIERLKQKNIFLRFYQVPRKQISEIPSAVYVKEIFLQAGFAHCVIIAQEKIDLPFKEIPLPKMGLEKMRQRLAEDERMKNLLIDEIVKYRLHREPLIEIKKGLEKELEFQEAVQGMGRAGLVSYLTGYVPIYDLEKVENAGRKQGWGLLTQDPSDADAPPVLLKNPRWIRLIEPVLKLLGIAPGYRELDVSPVFLIFFSIFFGILIGDAGYGLSYLLLAIWFQRKKGTPQNANIFSLFYLLSSCAILWGILTGAFFGQEWLIERGIKPVVGALNEPIKMQTLCFFLGAIHLTIAHAWRVAIKFPHLTSLADAGWIAVLWVAYFLARTLILGEVFPDFGLSLALLGIILILFFNEPRRNIFRRLGAGFTSVTFGLSFMSAFTDVVSYVRLFAVGLAGVAIANTTNAMAAGLGRGTIGFSAGILIRMVGHALNIVLGPIAILVHGVRLNVLEFSLNHTAITWSGRVYKPLTEKSA